MKYHPAMRFEAQQGNIGKAAFTVTLPKQERDAMTDGQKAFADGLKLPGTEAEEKRTDDEKYQKPPTAEQLKDFTPGQAAFAAGLKLPK
jgi:hypothetical protein